MSFLSLLTTAQAERFPIGDPTTTTSYLEITQVFSSSLNSGYDTVRWTVKNETAETLRFSVLAKSSVDAGRDEHELTSTHSFSAPPSQTSTATLLLPVLAINDEEGARYHGGKSALMTLVITGNANGRMGLSHSLVISQPAAAFSMTLTMKNVDRFNSDRGTHYSVPHSYSNDNGFAAEFDPPQLPADWRAYAGLDYLSMTTEEWLALVPEVRASVLQWVESGGVLSVYLTGQNDVSLLQMPTQFPDYGCGKIRTFPLMRLELNPAHLEEHYPSPTAHREVAPHPLLQNLREGPDTRWRFLTKALGERSFSVWQVALILLAFGILVGPVNLFVFAKRGQRHRLFWTTPLISLGASLLLVAYILLSDGTGGRGVRTSLAYVNPTAATVNVRQEQVSRTGVLFGGSFQIDEPAVVAPVVLNDSRWTRLKSGYGASAQEFSLRDGQWAGDWFQSRSEQAQSIQMVRSSRGRLELTTAAGAEPALRSSFGYPLETVFFVNEQGIWKSKAAVPTGGTVTMEISSEPEIQATLAQHLFKDHPSLAALKPQPGHFYAFTTDPTAEMVPTLKSIDWQENHTLVWGPIVAAP